LGEAGAPDDAAAQGQHTPQRPSKRALSAADIAEKYPKAAQGVVYDSGAVHTPAEPSLQPSSSTCSEKRSAQEKSYEKNALVTKKEGLARNTFT